MVWLVLFLAGIFEVAWVFALKASEGMTRVVPASLAALFAIVSLALLAVALKQLPLGVAYAVWTGMGVVGAALLGAFVLGEGMSALRALFMVFIVTGIVGLKVTSG